MNRTGAIIGFAALVGACSAEVKVSELAPGAPPGTPVDGIPFRTKERYIVKVYQKSDKGYVEVAKQMHTLPNPNKIYVLHHIGQLLSNSDTKFTLNDDGTLKTVHLGAQSQLDEAVTALEEQVSAAGTTIEKIETAKESERQAEEDLDVAYQTALNAATLAVAELAELPQDVAPSVLLAKQNEVRLKKLEANIAARRANLPRPFPEVTL
jgi:hypothetical protein